MPKRSYRDLASVLARKADGDAKAMRHLAANREIDDEAVGFHAQQAIEKWLKAALTMHGERYDREHDLGRLLQLLEKAGIDLPPGADSLDDLTIYAVELRYGDPLDGVPPLDREQVIALVDEIGEWGAAQLVADR